MKQHPMQGHLPISQHSFVIIHPHRSLNSLSKSQPNFGLTNNPAIQYHCTSSRFWHSHRPRPANNSRIAFLFHNGTKIMMPYWYSNIPTACESKHLVCESLTNSSFSSSLDSPQRTAKPMTPSPHYIALPFPTRPY